MPPGCPAGAKGRSSHAGARCHAEPCATDTECRDGAKCRPYRVCTRTSSVPPAGRGAFMSGAGPHMEELVIGSCEIADQCSGNEDPPPPVVGTLEPGPPTCREGSYCVPPAHPPLPPVAERSGEPPTTGTPRRGGGGASSGGGGPPENAPSTGVGTGAGCRGCSMSEAPSSAVVAGALVLASALLLAKRRRIR